jgi:hypothetical protein
MFPVTQSGMTPSRLVAGGARYRRDCVMDDGNVLVRYNHPAVNVVLSSVAQAHWPEIESHHQDALTPDEVLITPLGQNVFDDFGKKALLGRCYMFMDAQAPKVHRIERRKP